MTETVTITPIGPRVLVRVDDTPKPSPGGLHLPDTVRHNVTSGTVVAVGEGRLVRGRLVPVDARPGDRVEFAKYSGGDVSSVLPDHLMLHEDDILGRLAS